jgi:parallel beta-helix repeat protein
MNLNNDLSDPILKLDFPLNNITIKKFGRCHLLKKKNRFLLLFLFFFIFVGPTFLSNSVINILNKDSRNNIYSRNKVDTNLKISGFWEFSSIHIDGMGISGNGSWIWASAQPWCSGSGTWSDPYIIENIEIDANSIANGILIENSNVYFIIKNTTTYNSGTGFTAGIKLSSTINGQLLYNNCSFNNRQGILLSASNNNTIIGNILNNNTGPGLYLDVSDSNLIQDNTAVNNGHWVVMNSGIFIINSKNNTISGNFLNYNEDAGIKLKDTNGQNTIFNNTMFSNYNAGISLANANNTLISNNRIEDSPQKGIELRSSHNNVLIENAVKNCSSDGISINSLTGPSTFNIITNNNATGNYRGLLITDSDFNIITNNIVKNNTEGIGLSQSYDNIISNNTMKNNSLGLRLFSNSENNNITGNTVNFNYKGLNLISSNYNIFLNNNFLNNSITLSKTNSDGNYFENNDGLNNTGPLPITLSSNNHDPDRDGDFELSWSYSYGSDNYSVYIHNSFITEINSSVANLTTGYNQLTFPINDLGNGTHFFKVVGFNKFGNQSSNCVSATVIQGRPASCIFGYMFNPNNLRLDVWWDLNHEADNYSIYISNSTISKIDGNVTEIITGLEIHSYTYYGLTNGSNFFVIIAYNEFGNRWLSFEVVANLTIPGPFSLGSIAGDPDDDGFFLLNWTDSEGVLNHSIFMHDEYITQINSSVTLLEDGHFGNFYTVDNLYNGTYYFKVVAVNRWGNRSTNCISVNHRI